MPLRPEVEAAVKSDKDEVKRLARIAAAHLDVPLDILTRIQQRDAGNKATRSELNEVRAGVFTAMGILKHDVQWVGTSKDSRHDQ